MAVTYTIDTAGNLDSGAAAALLARVPGFTRTPEGVSAPDLYISIREPSDLKIPILEEALGFRPRLQISFRIHNLGDGSAAVDRILRATAGLLEQTSDDASLLLNGEDVVLTRLRGRLLLYSMPRFWTDARVKLMPGPSSFTEPMVL